MYLVNPTSVPVLTVVLVLALDLGAILGSFYLGARLLRAQKERYLDGGLAGAGALMLLLPIILGGRLFTYGTYQQFHAGLRRGPVQRQAGLCPHRGGRRDGFGPAVRGLVAVHLGAPGGFGVIDQTRPPLVGWLP